MWYKNNYIKYRERIYKQTVYYSEAIANNLKLDESIIMRYLRDMHMNSDTQIDSK